jgi:uncharacterized protein (DUF2236 family)
VPQSRAAAAQFIRAMQSELVSDARTREVARLVLAQRPPQLAMAPFQAMCFQAAVDLLPGWARRMHGLSGPTLPPPLVRAGTLGLARTLRWAFR